MNASMFRSLTVVEMLLGAVVVPPLLMFCYSAFRHSSTAQEGWFAWQAAGWSAWEALPYCVIAGTLVVSLAPFKRMRFRVLALLLYALISIPVLMLFGVVVACSLGDCI